MTLSNRHRASTALLLAGLLAFPSLPQEKPPQSRVTLHATTEIVLVDIVVKDRSGSLVKGLQASDFQVLEDNKPQKLLSCDFQNPDQAVLAALDAPPAPPPPPALTGLSPQPLPPEAPVPAASFNDRRLLILFFDFSGMQPDEIERSIAGAEKFVAKQMAPADLVAIATLSSSLQIMQDFTADHALLAKKLAQLRSASGEGFDAGTTGDTEGMPDTGSSFIADDSDFNTFNADRKLRALQSLAKALAPISQKKSIIYFSSGLTRNGIENQSQLRSTINAAAMANLALYTVDSRGLAAIPPGGGAEQASLRGVSAYSGAGVQRQYDANFSSQETLSTLAEDTGGKAFLDSNDLGLVFNRVHADTAAYYILSYHSANPLRDGRFRRITVRTTHPEWKLEYRAGYYADKDFAHSNRGDREEQLQKELEAELPVTDLGVYISTAYFRLAEGRYYVAVSLVVPGSQIPFAVSKDSTRATLDIIGSLREPKSGFQVGTIRDTVKLVTGAGDEIQRKNVQYNTGFLLGPGTFHLKCLLRENQSGMMGSFETDIVVPDLRKPLKKNMLRVSSVVIANQTKSASKPDRNDPLVSDGTELVPNVTHVFSATQHLLLYMEVYEPAKSTAPAPPPPDKGKEKDKTQAQPAPKNPVHLMSSVAFFRGNTKVFETPPAVIGSLDVPDRRAARVKFDVPLSQLPAGLYVCQVNIIDDAGGSFAFPRLPILIKK
jgi:VWFA-related protein